MRIRPFGTILREGMEHLSFLYYALAYSVSLPALFLVALAYLRTGERSLRSYVLFLASISFQLLCVALLRYLDAARIGSRAGAVSRHLYFFAESALVLAVPPVCHTLRAVSKAAAWNRAFGACYLICLALIASPFFVRYAPDGAAIYPRAGFFISESTVKSHVKSVYRKISVGSRVQLMNALRTGD